METCLSNFSGQRYTAPSDVSVLNGLREAFSAFLYEAGVPAAEVETWQLVFSEVLVNAIKHGNQSEPSKTVEVTWQLAGEEIVLEVADEGTGPPEEKLDSPELPEDPLATGGRGLFLIEQFTDRREHWRGTKGYRTRLARRHPGIEGASAADTVLDQALDELSTSYESLAAFYRLGEGLVNAENVSRFMARAFEDLSTVARHDFLQIAFTADFQPALAADLNAAPLVSKEPLSQRQRGVTTKANEFVWESPEEVADDPLLAPYACGICTAVQAGAVLQGVLTVARKHNTPYFNAGELNTIRTFADLIGIAVVSANNTLARSREARALRELEIASEMQNNLLPLPRLRGEDEWSLFARREGAREVAGDHIEAALSDDGDLYLVCIDVMGKGVSAAFLAAIFRTAFNLSVDFTTSLPELADKLNRVLIQQMGELTMFATCAIARVCADLSKVEVLNAGHCPVVIGRTDGSCDQVDPSGPPLGLFAESSYTVEDHPLKPGESLLMVTDGLYEWERGGDIWGWDAFIDFFLKNREQDPLDLWDALCAKIDAESSEGLEAGDDRTILYWKRR
ncbi:MAG: SpoIIE family protein phosphatase [Opitutales bacterium]